MPDTFKNRFIKAKEMRNIKWIDIARKSGLDKAQISQYKNGIYEPMQDALYKLAIALNVNVAWLMGFDVPMNMTMEQSEQKSTVFELIKKNYGNDTYHIFCNFLKLDQIDKGKIAGRIELLLESDKYNLEKN